MLVENKVKENQSSRRDETLVKSTSIIDLTNIASLRDAIDFMTSETEMLTLETEKFVILSVEFLFFDQVHDIFPTP